MSGAFQDRLSLAILLPGCSPLLSSALLSALAWALVLRDALHARSHAPGCAIIPPDRSYYHRCLRWRLGYTPKGLDLRKMEKPSPGGAT